MLITRRRPLKDNMTLYCPICRQPNEQARVVAPVVDGATLKRVAFSGQARNMIIVRHPFDR